MSRFDLLESDTTTSLGIRSLPRSPFLVGSTSSVASRALFWNTSNFDRAVRLRNQSKIQSAKQQPQRFTRSAIGELRGNIAARGGIDVNFPAGRCGDFGHHLFQRRGIDSSGEFAFFRVESEEAVVGGQFQIGVGAKLCAIAISNPNITAKRPINALTVARTPPRAKSFSALGILAACSFWEGERPREPERTLRFRQPKAIERILRTLDRSL